MAEGRTAEVEPEGLVWRKSTFSNIGECVAVAEVSDGVAIRNSQQPDAGTVVVPRREIAALIAGAKAGEFDDLAR